MPTATLKPSVTETSKKSWFENLQSAVSSLNIRPDPATKSTHPSIVNSASVGPAAAGEVQFTPPWQVPVWQFPSLSQAVLPQMRPEYPEGRVTVLCPSRGPRVKPPSEPPLAAGKIPGSTGVEQKLTIVTELKIIYFSIFVEPT